MFDTARLDPAAPRRRSGGDHDIVVKLPNPPQRRLVPDPVASERRAQQAAERAIATHALDAAGIEATPGDLPYEAVRAGQARLEAAEIPVERAESEGAGEELLEDLRQGAETGPCKEADGARHLVTVTEAAEKATDDVTAKTDQHDRTVAVLNGDETRADGTRRPGSLLFPGARWMPGAIVLAMIGEALPVIVPVAVEGVAVSTNMAAYLRTDDAQWWIPAAIAVLALVILTGVPYLAGISMNKLAHGGRLHPATVAVLGAAALFWAATGIVLALIRVSVDRAGALRAAEAARSAEIERQQSFGQSGADVPPIDPSAVFDPTIPTILWIVVFLGFGVALLLWETLRHNPARLDELQARASLKSARRRMTRIREHQARQDGVIGLQTTLNAVGQKMWAAQAAVVAAAAEKDVAIHHEELGLASRDPAVPVAIEQHKAYRAGRRTQEDGR